VREKKTEIIILLCTAALIVSFSIVGLTTYNNLKKIERLSGELYYPNKTMLDLRMLIAELRNSESNVRLYNLYKNDDDLEAYAASVKRIDQYYDSLKQHQTGNNVSGSLLDSVRTLILKKRTILNEQLTLRDNEYVVNQLDRINQKLKKTVLSDTIKKNAILKSSGPEKKKGMFRRLFSRDNDEVVVKDSVVPKELNKQFILEVEGEVNKARIKQLTLLDDVNKREVELLAQDKELMNALTSLFSNLEQEQNEKLRAIAGENIAQTNWTNSLIKVFGVLMVSILFLLGGFAIFHFYQARKLRHNLIHTAMEAKKLAKTRENFLSNMSHEMRTPLNSIIGFTEQVLQTKLEAHQKEQIELVNTSSLHLLDLVNNLLDKARIDAGKVTIENSDFNLYHLLKSASSILDVKAREKNIALVKDIRIKEDLMINGDPVLLRQIVINILGNAIKFTHKGQVTIQATLKGKVRGRNLVVINIKDTGIGIPEEKLGKIFNHFEQVDSTINREYGGTGLGLSITKDVVDILEGEINVESEVGKGTEVNISLLYPDALNKTTENINVQNDLNTDHLKSKSILVVDDEKYNRKLLAVILKKYNIDVWEAGSGREALDLLNKELPDLALVDINMAGMDGLKMVGNIRMKTDIRYKELPVIAVTADLTEEKKEKYIASGFNDCLMKPFNEKSLINLISKTIITHEMEHKI
jgi:signal transduction histidine kinase/CheY-like chemotaxis protein